MRRIAACLLTLLPLAHGEGGPSDAAVSFLIDVARERIKLAEDTAMADGTTREKQQNIRERLRILSSSVDQGELKAVDERIEGDLAAVIVSRMIDYDPSQVEVHAIAMLKRDDQWLAAPVPASFENTGITYLPGLSETAEELEIWMIKQRGIHLAKLRDNIQADLMADIRKAGSIEELRDLGPEQVIERFIKACRERELPAALACLGGLEESLPDDWEEILRFTAGSIRTADAPTEAWRRMVNTASARAVVLTDVHERGATISIGEFAPFESRPGEPEITILHFPLSRSKEGLWRARLPSWLLDGAPPASPDATDAELVAAFPAKLLATYPPKDFDTPDKLATTLQQALAGRDFEAIFPLMEASKDGNELAILQHAADLWREFRGRTGQVPLLLDVRQEDDEACALIARIDSRNPRIRSTLIKSIYLRRGENGWAIPAGDPNGGGDPALTQWAEELSRQSEAEWLGHLGIAAKLGGIAADSAPSEAGTRAAAEAWLTAVQSRDPRKILATVAYFDDDRGVERLLRTIGHELQAEDPAVILGVHREGRWAAVSTRTLSANRSDPPYHLLYPVVATPLGPRVLAEAALYHADTRSREFLNSAIWNRLSSRLPEAAVTELKAIQKSHDQLVDDTPSR